MPQDLCCNCGSREGLVAVDTRLPFSDLSGERAVPLTFPHCRICVPTGHRPPPRFGRTLAFFPAFFFLSAVVLGGLASLAPHAIPRTDNTMLAAILIMVVMLGFFLPPVSIILMTAPIILPPLRAANFDIIWFGVVMTIVMEMGLIHPPVGLNIFVIRNVAPDIPLIEVIWGTLPFVLLMMAAVVVLCLLPEISTYLPDLVMGPDGGR